MRNYILLALMLLVCGELYIVDGGTCEPAYCVIVGRNPFYHSIQEDGYVNDLSITINHPTNTSYSSATQDVNVTISGGTPGYTCKYRIDDNSWNSYDCSNPKTVTFHSLYNTLTVAVTDSLGYVATDSVSFTVFDYHGGGPGRWDWSFWLLLVVVLFFLFMDDSRKKRSRPRHRLYVGATQD